MTLHIHVDRNAELALLEQVLHPQAVERILLLHAPAGFGKSLLLEQYIARLNAAAVKWGLIDLITTGIGPLEFLGTLCDEWGWENFPGFAAILNRPLTMVVEGAKQIGFGQRLEVRSGEDPGQRRERILSLTAAWIGDCTVWLQRVGRAVIVVDTYDPVDSADRKATVDPELKSWLESVFLGHVRRTSGLRLILAGKQLPEASLTWETCCHRHRLGPISDPDDWMAWVEGQGIAADRQQVHLACYLAQGEPLRVVMHLGLLRSWGGVA